MPQGLPDAWQGIPKKGKGRTIVGAALSICDPAKQSGSSAHLPFGAAVTLTCVAMFWLFSVL